jgi:chromosome partitioning related protein ParA
MPNTTVISVVSTKGGVTKTTFTANLGALLAALGLRVLLIDADKQPSLSKFFKLSSTPTTGLADVLKRGGMIQPGDIVQTEIVGLDIIVSNLSEEVEAWLESREDRLIILKRCVRAPIVRETYDVVLIDSKGASCQMTRTAAMAGDIMVSPMKPDVISFAEFQTGTIDMLTTINSMAEDSGSSLFRSGPLKIVISCMTRTNNAKFLSEQIYESFRNHPNIQLLDTKIPSANVYELSRTLQKPVHLLDIPISGQARGNTAYEIMHKLAFELLPNLTNLWAGEPPKGEEDMLEVKSA